MKKITIIIVLLSIVVFRGTAFSRTKMQVDCKNNLITFTFTAWAPNTVSDDDIKQIQEAVQKYWNPKTRHKYYDCDVKVVVNIISERTRKKKGSESTFVVSGTDPEGGGATLQKGSGSKNVPTVKSMIEITRLPNGKLKLQTIAHELGHGMGIDDPAPTAAWDRNGIKPSHIKQIIDKATFITAGGRVFGWEAYASCCRPLIRAFPWKNPIDDPEEKGPVRAYPWKNPIDDPEKKVKKPQKTQGPK